MKNLHFPIKFAFKISTFASDFIATDANNHTLAYVKQKLFKFIEEVQVYSDDTKTEQKYTIKANKRLDFTATYEFTDKAGAHIGKVARKGWASIWKSNYEVFTADGQQEYSIHEENPWIKVLDALLKEIPLLGMFSGYFFNPSYKVVDKEGNIVVRLKKDPSFFGRKFTISKVTEKTLHHEESIMLSLMMMILLERRRG